MHVYTRCCRSFCTPARAAMNAMSQPSGSAARPADVSGIVDHSPDSAERPALNLSLFQGNRESVHDGGGRKLFIEVRRMDLVTGNIHDPKCPDYIKGNVYYIIESIGEGWVRLKDVEKGTYHDTQITDLKSLDAGDAAIASAMLRPSTLVGAMRKKLSHEINIAEVYNELESTAATVTEKLEKTDCKQSE